MAVQVKNNYVVATFLGSGVIFPNNSTASQGANSAGETVNTMSVVQASWSCGNNAYFTVSRGANVVALYSETGSHDYQSSAMTIDAEGGNQAANCVITKTGAGPAFLTLRLHKKVTLT